MVYTDKKNTLKISSIHIIALRESHKYGGHFFMSIYTRKEIHSNDWVELPIEYEVVKRVEELYLVHPKMTYSLILRYESKTIYLS